ncbi:MAG: hypothetical protein ACUVWJ_10690 [Spirochaetota bacterium]
MKTKLIAGVALSGVIAISLILFSSCSRKSLVEVKTPKRGKVGEEYIVQQSPSKTPKWVEDPEFQVKKEKGEKLIYVIADISEYKDKRAAERIAEGELRKKIAEGIKTLVQSQFGEVMKGTQDEYKESFESYVLTVAENVAVVGLVVTDTYWEKIERIKSEKEVEYIYRVVKRGKMPYKNYVTARDKAWDDVLKGISREDEKQELRRLIEEMKRADAT